MSYDVAQQILRDEAARARMPVSLVRSGRRTRCCYRVRERVIRRCLLETDLSLLEIALLVGLKSPVRNVNRLKRPSYPRDYDY